MDSASQPSFDPKSNYESNEPPLVPRRSSARVPLSFWQELMWTSLRRLGVTHRQRKCIAAIQISGQLDVCTLQRSHHEVVTRHESLRTVIVEFDEIPAQEICDADGYELRITDLTGSTPAEIEIKARRTVEAFVNEKISLRSAPMFGSMLVKLGDHDHILVLAMDHMISDGFSMNILSRDLWTSYFQFAKELPLSLPEMPVQFPDYAIWQRDALRWWIGKHGTYWEQRLTDAPRVRFPVERRTDSAARYNLATAPIEFGPSLCNGLRQLSHREHTTLPIVMLAAYAATILRWQDKSSLTVGMLVHGRSRIELENMIGYVASMLYLRIELRESDSFLDFLERTTEEFCTAYDHQSPGCITLQSGETEFTRSTSFNWFPPQYPHATKERFILNSDDSTSTDEIRLGPFPYTQPTFDAQGNCGSEEIVDYDPRILLCETGNEIVCSLVYISNRFKPATMEGLMRNFRGFAQHFLQLPQERVITKYYDQ